MIYVVDASVAVKWFVNEDGHQKSILLLRDDNILCAPDIILAEVANTFRRKISSNEMSYEQAVYAIEDFLVYIPETIPSSILVFDAFSLSIELSHPLADCLYLACARHVGGCLVSADEKFLDKCRPKFSALVVSINSLEYTQKLVENTSAIIEKETLDALVHASAIFQQTKINIERNWLDRDVVDLARERLFKVIEGLDQNQRIYLQAVCWFGESNIIGSKSHDLLGLWFDRLDHARQSLSSDINDGIAYLIPRLQSLDAGLRLLSNLTLTPEK